MLNFYTIVILLSFSTLAFSNNELVEEVAMINQSLNLVEDFSGSLVRDRKCASANPYQEKKQRVEVILNQLNNLFQLDVKVEFVESNCSMEVDSFTSTIKVCVSEFSIYKGLGLEWIIAHEYSHLVMLEPSNGDGGYFNKLNHSELSHQVNHENCDVLAVKALLALGYRYDEGIEKSLENMKKIAVNEGLDKKIPKLLELLDKRKKEVKLGFNEHLNNWSNFRKIGFVCNYKIFDNFIKNHTSINKDKLSGYDIYSPKLSNTYDVDSDEYVVVENVNELCKRYDLDLAQKEINKFIQSIQ